ncbi:MAG: hypothetical protein WC829_12465 [Hyphomicrobium sp.]|jgi:hypothetical protein
MLEAWFATMMLIVESGDVMRLRMLKLSGGGGDAYAEAGLMVREKYDAALEAQTALWTGGSASSVVQRYREHVAANAKRLTA